MSKKIILKMCQEIVEGKQPEEGGFNCIGIYCKDCPIGKFKNNGISCHDNTEENIIAAAEKYIAENTEEKEVENKFKVGDRVKKNNGKVFLKNNGVDKMKTEKTFKEVIADIKEGEVWELNKNAIYCDKFGLHINFSETIVCEDLFIDKNAKYKLKRKQYTFAEAFAAYEEGKEIQSCVSGREWPLKILSFNTFTIEEIKNKWYINN